MNKIACIALFVALGIVTLTRSVPAEDRGPVRYEYAVVKWDGPDRLFYNLPNSFELVHLQKDGVEIPRAAQNEEFCLAYAANKMARDGWEALNLDSRRILLRRPAR
jgi:hypothetical protein